MDRNYKHQIQDGTTSKKEQRGKLEDTSSYLFIMQSLKNTKSKGKVINLQLTATKKTNNNMTIIE